MNFGKVLLAGLVVPALVIPSIATAAVRPSAKAVVAAAKSDRSLAVRTTRASAKLENENQVFLIGLPLLLAAAAVAAVVATVVVVADDESSPD